MSGVRQSKITKCPLLAALGGKGLILESPLCATTYCFIYCTGVGANVILDCVGSSFVKQNLKSIGTDGRWVLYGLLGGGNVDGNILGALLKKRVSLLATTLRSRSIEVS